MARRSFEDWMKAVNQHLLSICGMEADDLPDAAYRDNYDEGTSPKAMAKKVLTEEGFYSFKW